MHHETWTTEQCPLCQVLNWINHGDTNDCTAPDLEACKCWKCEKKFFFDEDNLLDDSVALEDAFCVWGRSNPSDPYRYCE